MDHLPATRARVAAKSASRLKPLCAVLCALFGCDAAHAATIFVTSCADDGSPGTLRSQAGSGGIVDLTALTCSTITLTQGALSYYQLSIVGPTDRRISIVGSGSDRLFQSGYPGSDLGLYNVTISGGRITPDTAVPGGGACVVAVAAGLVVLNNATVTDCRSNNAAGIKGGAIYAADVALKNGSVISDSPQVGYPGSAGGGVWAPGEFYCSDSTVSNNSISGAGSSAGGVYSKNATLKGCTIEGNSPGGLRVRPSGNVTTVIGSTISGNTQGYGLDVEGSGSLQISNSTIAGNGGGVYSVTDLTAQSSIFANNGEGFDVYLSRSQMYGADNLVVFTNLTDSQDAIPPASGVIVSTSNPRLAPLGRHGGNTRTRALLAGSPALDIGNNKATLTTDQRGAPRESPAGKPDIGAYERQGKDDELFYDGFEGYP